MRYGQTGRDFSIYSIRYTPHLVSSPHASAEVRSQGCDWQQNASAVSPLKILSLHGFGVQASFSSSFKSSEAPSLLASQGLEKSESGSSKCRSSFHILEEILVLTETDCL